jgi:hypothetical protein
MDQAAATGLGRTSSSEVAYKCLLNVTHPTQLGRWWFWGTDAAVVFAGVAMMGVISKLYDVTA